MDKYTLLLVLNLPFVIFGLLRALEMRKTKVISLFSLCLRIVFWLSILSGLAFSEEIFDFLVKNGLTDSTPLSIADVVLSTGVMFSLFLCVRIYAKIESFEKRFNDLHEKTSIEFSNNKRTDTR